MVSRAPSIAWCVSLLLGLAGCDGEEGQTQQGFEAVEASADPEWEPPRVSTIRLPAAEVLYREINGSYDDCLAEIARLQEELEDHRLDRYGDPFSVYLGGGAAGGCTYRVGFSVPPGTAAWGDLRRENVPARLAAYILPRGPYCARRRREYDHLRDWIDERGYLTDGLLYDYYQNWSPEVGADELLLMTAASIEVPGLQ
jgi:effector-binding domain-containing protein